MAPTSHVVQWPGAESRRTLRDGSAVHVRAATPADETAVRRFLAGVSSSALFLRFFGVPRLDRAARALVHSDPGDWTLIAEDADGEVVGHAACLRLNAETAEVAFLVADDWQGRGLGGLLLRQLVQLAAGSGIAVLTAETLHGNDRLLSLLSRSGLVSRIADKGDTVTVRLKLAHRPLPLAA